MTSASSSNNKNVPTDQFPSENGIFFPYPQTPTSTTDPLQSTSAPNSRVYLNMGNNSQRRERTAVELTATTPESPGTSNPYTNYPLPSSAMQGQNNYQRPHRTKARNRYPYVPFYGRRRPKILNAPALGLYTSNDNRQDKTSSLRHKRDEFEDEEDNRPPRSFWVVLRLIFFVLAIEFMEALEIALTVPILTKLHVDESYYSLAWVVSPIIGFFLQPVIGMWSDTLKCRWGRRRPFILAFAIGAYLGIALILNSADLGVILGDDLASEHTVPIRAVLLIGVGVTLLDFCGDTANSPIRAYLIDTMNSRDQERGFILHAILGIGGGLGFTAGTIKWPAVPIFRSEGGDFSIIFFIATFVAVVSTILTLTSVREEPLPLPSASNENEYRKNSHERGLEDFHETTEIELDERRPLLLSDQNSSRTTTLQRKPKRQKSNRYINDLKQYEGFLEFDPATGERVPYDHVTETQNHTVLLETLENTHQSTSTRITPSDSTNRTVLQSQEFGNELQQKAKLVKLGLMRRSDYDDENEVEKNVTIKSMIISMIRMPSRLWKLMICQIIGSAGYYATHLYFTEFMAVEVYNGTVAHDSHAPPNPEFELGVEMGCWGLFVFAVSGAVYAFCLECGIAERVSLKLLYFIGYFVYVIGCTVNFFVQQVVVNIAMCFTFGILVVSLKTLPFQMLAQFHADETYRNRDGSRRGIGIDCSLLNSCIFLGELIIAASLSPLVKVTAVKYCMLVAAVLTFLGNISMLFLFYLSR